MSGMTNSDTGSTRRKRTALPVALPVELSTSVNVVPSNVATSITSMDERIWLAIWSMANWSDEWLRFSPVFLAARKNVVRMHSHIPRLPREKTARAMSISPSVRPALRRRCWKCALMGGRANGRSTD